MRNFNKSYKIGKKILYDKALLKNSHWKIFGFIK
jgi:hypothetical protein